jgi:hypothetical protein
MINYDCCNVNENEKQNMKIWLQIDVVASSLYVIAPDALGGPNTA